MTGEFVGRKRSFFLLLWDTVDADETTAFVERPPPFGQAPVFSTLPLH